MKTILMLAALLLAVPLTAAVAQDEHKEHHPEGEAATKAEAAPSEPMGMMEKCKMMEQHMAAMKEKKTEMNARLDDLLEEMNTSTGGKKADAIAAAVNVLVAQHREMDKMHAEMQEHMMKHMGEHAMEAGGKGMGAMMKCPMMQGSEEGAADGEKGTEEDHEAHH